MSTGRRVAEHVSNLRRDLLRRAWGAAALWAGVGLAAVLLLAWLLAGSGGWRQGTRTPLALDALFLAGILVGGWVLHGRISRWLSDARIGRSLEEAARLPRGTVLGSLELGRGLPRGSSASLAARAERGVVRRLGSDGTVHGGELARTAAGWGRRGWRSLGALGTLLLVAVVATPERSTSAWRGLGTPVALLAAPELPPLSIEPIIEEIGRGEDLSVRVLAAGRDSAVFHWQAAGDVARRRSGVVAEGAVGFTLRDVRAPVRYWATARDGARTPVHRVVPVDPLFVGDVSLRLTFPPHTSRPPEEYRGDVSPLVVPSGTRIAVEGRASRALSAASLVPVGSGEPFAFTVDGRGFAGRWTPRVGGTYRWDARDADGKEAEVRPLPLQLTVVPDSAPVVRFTDPARDTVLPLDLRQPLVLEAQDDHGVETLELVAYRVTSLGDREEPVVQRLEVGGSRAVLARPIVDVSDWGLLPGDVVRYYARAVDNAPRPDSATTPEFALRMPGADELRRTVEAGLAEAANSLESLTERAERARQETSDLERRAGASGAGDPSPPFERQRSGSDRAEFQQREEVRRAIQEQSGMEAGVDSLRRSLREMSDALREQGAADPDTEQDLQELEALLDEMSTPETRQRLDEMLAGLEEMDAEEARRTLEELQAEQEAFRERLESSLERFKRAAVEQDFRATAAEAEELAQRESALADAFREEDAPERRAEQQDELEAQARELDAGMRRLEQRLQELGEQDAARGVRAAREDAAAAREAMQRAGRQARQGEGERAGAEADQAAGEMDEAGRRLQEAQRQMRSEQAEALQAALRRAADDALSLARRQSGIQREMRGAGRERLSELRGDIAAVRQGAGNMAENLEVSSGAAGGAGAGPELAERIGQAMQALDRTVDAIEGRTGAAPSPESAAEAAVDALNRVALLALEGARSMSQGSQQEASAGGDMQQELQGLAQQQGQLNNQTGQVMPMGLGQQALRQQLEQLSQGQGSVASELERLAGERGAGDQPLGDLEALAREAEALARELGEGRLDPDTRRRQERLFHRLLDAGRGLEKEETSEERESRAAGAFDVREVLPLGADALNALRFRLPAASALQRLTPAERQLVIQYFERLNAAPRTGGGGR